jgi:predicted transposase
MITMKIKYEASDEARAFILKCRRQYSSALRFAYNRVIGGWSGNERKKIKHSIVFPDGEAYRASISKSLEEFGLDDGTTLLEAYEALKKSGDRYRLSHQSLADGLRCFPI